MTEVINSSQPHIASESLVLDGHKLYTKNTNLPVSPYTLYDHLDTDKLNATTLTPRIEHVDRAYKNGKIDLARYILDRLTRDEPATYSSTQSRIALKNLARPIQDYLVLTEKCAEIPATLPKDIEAIYGQGGDQLAFLIEQFDMHQNVDGDQRTYIEGSLSELTVFLLSTRELTDDTTNPYLIVPSTEGQDYSHITADGRRHGFDLLAVRQRDNVHIPIQVKTSFTRQAKYADDILVVSVADLVRDNNASPRNLAEALYFEVNGAQNCDTALIEAASKRLFAALDTY
jgi:hypothetical protein